MNENMNWLSSLFQQNGQQTPTLDFTGSNYNPTQSSVLGGIGSLSGGGSTVPGATGFNFSSLLNLDNLGSLAQGIGSLGQLYMGGQQLGLAKDAFNLSKQAYRQNMANSIASYNTSLEDKIRGRTSNYAGKEQDVQDYLNNNKLS